MQEYLRFSQPVGLNTKCIQIRSNSLDVRDCMINFTSFLTFINSIIFINYLKPNIPFKQEILFYEWFIKIRINIWHFNTIYNFLLELFLVSLTLRNLNHFQRQHYIRLGYETLTFLFLDTPCCQPQYIVAKKRKGGPCW